MRRVLLEFDFLGEVLGLVIDGEPQVVTKADGTVRSFIPGADVESLPHRSSPIIGGASGDQTVTVTLNAGVRESWGLRRTAPIQLATCRVYWWPEGEVLRDEHELFRGAVREPDWQLSSSGEGVLSFTLVPARRIDDVAFPPALVGDDGRFPAAPDEARTFAVPVIYGAVPGLPLAAISDPLVNPVRLIVAGHRLYSTTVQVMRDGVAVGAADTVLYAVDALGSTYAYVEVTDVQYAAGSNLYLQSVEGHTIGGKLISGLGDVLEHAFRTYAGASWFELDRPRVEAAKPTLNRIAVGAFANERSDGTVMQFMQQRLGGQFPVAFSAAGGRLGWDAVLFPRGTDLDVVVGRIVFGQDCGTRVGPTETSADDVLTDIELTYGFDGFQAGSVQSLNFNPANSGDARRAASRWGRSPVLTQEAPDCPDSNSAYLLLTDIALKRTRVRHRVEYQGLNERYYFLPLVGVVEVVDAELGWDGELCLIEAVEPRKDGLVDIVLITVDGQ